MKRAMRRSVGPLCHPWGIPFRSDCISGLNRQGNIGRDGHGKGVAERRFPDDAPLTAPGSAATRRVSSVVVPLASAWSWTTPGVAGPRELTRSSQAVSLAWPARQTEWQEFARGIARADDLSDTDELIELLVAPSRQASLTDDFDKIFGDESWN